MGMLRVAFDLEEFEKDEMYLADEAVGISESRISSVIYMENS